MPRELRAESNERTVPATSKLGTITMVDFNVNTPNAAKLKELRKQAHLDQRGFATLSNNSRETIIKFAKDGKVSDAAGRSIAKAARLMLALSQTMESSHNADWLRTPDPKKDTEPQNE